MPTFLPLRWPRWLIFLSLALPACQPSGGVPSADFTLSLSPTSLTLTPGVSWITALTLTPQNGFSGTVSLSLERQDGSPAPSGLTLSPTSLSVSGKGAVNRTLTLNVASSVAAGDYPLRVKATSGGLTQTANLSLTVQQSGASWTAQTSGTGNPLYGVTYANSTFVAVGLYGTILTSP